MKWNMICQVLKADFLERTRRFSFLAICAITMFFSFLSVPNIKAPFVSICLEPNIFRQGSNSSWIPITIALCGGILFPMIGLSFVKNNISKDRNTGLLYIMQSMNMPKASYVIGKYLSNLFLLTIMWILTILGAAIMLPFQFPNQLLNFHDFISPFIGIYPGIIFASALAIFLESVPFISGKISNAIGITTLFVIFLINYSTSDSNYPLIRIFDFSNYRWIMESINNAVIPIIGHEVLETGILVPGGMFADSKGVQELFFHGMTWNSQYFADKILLIFLCFVLVVLAIVFLDQTEQSRKVTFHKSQKKNKTVSATTHYTSSFVTECKMLYSGLPKLWYILIAGLWVYSIFAPLKYVQGYLWIIMLIFFVVIFSQMGCREYEHNLMEYFITIKSSLIKSLIYSCIGGIITSLVLSIPIITRCLITQNYVYSLGYMAFSFFIPALACFFGVYTKSRRTFETIYLLICFLIINMPTILFQGNIIIIMIIGTIVLMFSTLVRILQL